VGWENLTLFLSPRGARSAQKTSHSLLCVSHTQVGALYQEYGLSYATQWALAAIEAAGLDPRRVGLELNAKALLILTAADHLRIAYRGRQVRAGGWDGHSSSHPVRASARIGISGGTGEAAVEAAAAAAAALRGGGPPPAAPLVWVAECVVDGSVAGTGVDVHRATAEQAAAKEALAAVFAVDADEVWRAKVADQM